MTFLEVIQLYVLPLAGGLGGLTALVIFIFSRRQRIAETIKTEAEINEMIEVTPAKLTQMIIEASSKALEGQNIVNASLQKRLVYVTERMTAMECRDEKKEKIIEAMKDRIDQLEKKLGIKEANIVALEEKLARYELENETYRKENMKLKMQVDSQLKRIKELEDQLVLIHQELRERGCE